MRSAICLMFSGLLMNGSLIAKHWHDDEKHWKKHASRTDDDKHGSDHHAKGCYFEPQATRVLVEYYAPRFRELPPGLQKKIYRTGRRLPPGWERKMQPLPVVVDRQLPPLPGGYSRGYIDGFAVVYSPRTQIVIDIVAVFGR